MIEITIPTPEQGLGGQSGTIQALAVQLFDSQGNTAHIPNGALEVFVSGGTIQSTISFSGTVNADIGSVKINDVAGNFAEVPAANEAKNGGNKAMLVQQIDETGATLRQSTLMAIMNHQGTNASSADISGLQAAVDANLAMISNHQGTLATDATASRIASSSAVLVNAQGTLATSAAQATGNAVLAGMSATETALLNSQGTLATSANQVTGNAFLLSLVSGQASQATAANQTSGNATLSQISTDQQTTNSTLTAILNAQGTQSSAAVQSGIASVANNQGTQATSAGVAVVANNLGTVATAANQAVGNATVAVVMNNQGTQATSANQVASNATLGVIMNNEGTLATSANQVIANDTLSKIYNAAGTDSTTILLPPLTAAMNNQGTLATSAKQDVGNAALTVIMNTQGTQATAAGQTTLNNTMAAVMNNEGTLASAAGQITGNAYLLTLATNSALQATAANQQVQIAQQASTIRTYGASGTAASSSQTVLMGLDPSSVSTDSFGRLRVSTPDYRFDGQLTYDIPTDLWDKAFNSTGTITYDSTNRMAALTCAAGGTAVLQSHKYAPYTPGRSQLAFITFIMGATPNANVSRRAGYYDGTNGIYLEQTSTGIQLVLASTTGNGNQTVPQASWNIDKMNGNGPSGLTLDLSKVQILAISLQALYAGRVIVGFDINGILWPVHAFVHANLITTPYIANASLPVRYEVRSTGASSGTLSALCASVMSEGGNNLAAIPGRTFAAARTTVLQINARLPLLSIRAKAFYNSLPNTGIILANTFSASSSAQPIYLELVRNATLTAAAWTNVDANSTAEFDVTASALAGGSTVYGVVIGSGAGATQMPIDANLLDRLVIAAAPLLNTQDTLTICATSLSGNTNVGCAMTWKEVR